VAVAWRVPQENREPLEERNAGGSAGQAVMEFAFDRAGSDYAQTRGDVRTWLQIGQSRFRRTHVWSRREGTAGVIAVNPEPAQIA